jgi:hypothetical protein
VIYIRPSLPGDTWLILQDLREAEVKELEALGITSEVNVRYGLMHSQAHTVMINDEPVGIFGLMDYGDHVVPWGVFTTVIDRHPLPFLRACKRWANNLKGPAVNVVDARNFQAVKWFKWMGFEVSEPVRHGLNGELFREVRVS